MVLPEAAGLHYKEKPLAQMNAYELFVKYTELVHSEAEVDKLIYDLTKASWGSKKIGNGLNPETVAIECTQLDPSDSQAVLAFVDKHFDKTLLKEFLVKTLTPRATSYNY